MKEAYAFMYFNENEFKKLERSLKKYNMLAYKKLYFDYYPSLKEGSFLGIINNSTNEFDEYELKLPTDMMFSKVHGDIKLHYQVMKNEKVVKLLTLTPEKILTEGHQSELVTYKGVMISKDEPEKDMFKINLLKMIQK